MEGLLVQEAEHGANHRDATRTWLDIRRKIEKLVKGRLPVAYCMKYKLWKSSLWKKIFRTRLNQWWSPESSV